MNNTNLKKVLVITNSNIFFECIKRILIFTLKTEFIQNDDYGIFIQDPNKLADIDLLVLDYRFMDEVQPGILGHLIKTSNKSSTFHIYVDSNCKLNSTKRVQIIKPDTSTGHISGIEGAQIVTSERGRDRTMNSLTRKESTIAKLISKGLNNKQIAKNQNISEKTVKAHLTSIYRKLNLKNRFELMLNANKTF